MSAKSNLANNVLFSIPSRMSHAGKPTPRPANAQVGATGGGVNNYGQPRGAPLGAYPPSMLEQWRSGAATTQQMYAHTRLPGGPR